MFEFKRCYLVVPFLGFTCSVLFAQEVSAGPVFQTTSEIAIYTYKTVLKRDPENARVIANDSAFLDKLGTYNQIKRNFEIKATSTEFMRKLKGQKTTKGKLNFIYSALLGRDCDATGYRGYGPLLKAKGPQEVIHRIIWNNSTEFNSKMPLLQDMKSEIIDPPVVSETASLSKMVELGPRSRLYRLKRSNVKIQAEKLVMILGGASETAEIICAGPNRIYYKIEGNAPFAERNSSGFVKPGERVNVTLTAIMPAAFRPKLYLISKDGPTAASVFLGPIKFMEFFNNNNINKCIKIIHDVLGYGS